jgi:hypothetical protein
MIDLIAAPKRGIKGREICCFAWKHGDDGRAIAQGTVDFGRKSLSLTIKKSGPFFGNRAMLFTNIHQAWRLSKRHDDPWN